MRMAVLAVVAISVAACANDVTSPRLQPAPERSVAVGDSAGHGPWGFGRRGMGFGPMMFASRRLPANLKLTDAQRTQMKSLMMSFRAGHKDDLDAISATMKEAFAARKTGTRFTPDQRKALFAQTAPARQRLMAANKELRAQVEQILTPDQKSWLASHHPTRPARHGAA